MADAAERASDVDLTQAQLRAAAADFASGAADDADPNQSGFLYNLCATQYRLGRLLSQRGERDAAVATLTASVDTAVRVREIEPTAESRERLAMALNSLGRAVADRGDLAGALPHYQRCLQECEQLVDSEPENARYLDDLAIILDVLAGVLDRLRRRDEAIAHAVRAIAVNDRITVVDPTVKRFSELGLSYSRAAHYFKARRDFESALRHFTDALRIHEALADQFPQQPTHQIDVIHALDNLSAVEFSRDDHHAAGPYPERAFALATRLVDADPHSVEHHRELARRAYKCAVIRELLGDPTAREAYVASQRAFTWIDAAGMLTEQDGRELADVNRALSRGAGG